jgi:hypothetical protein
MLRDHGLPTALRQAAAARQGLEQGVDRRCVLRQGPDLAAFVRLGPTVSVVQCGSWTLMLHAPDVPMMPPKQDGRHDVTATTTTRGVSIIAATAAYRSGHGQQRPCALPRRGSQ